MNASTRRLLGRSLATLASIAILAAPAIARAQGPVEAPTPDRDPSVYPVEIEPHFAFATGGVYTASGFGAGLRVSIPIVPDLLHAVPDNLAITFGGDLLHYSDCYYGDECGANYLMLPVGAQWNVFVARRVSLFAEAGLYVYKGFFNQCPGNGPGCSAPSDFGLGPMLAVGVRVHIGDNVSFNARLGYPTFTLGVSFL
jgi:hypothetical protein